MVPGEKTVMTFNDNDKSMAIYCFYTKPGKMWKSYLSYDHKNEAYYIDLGENEIEDVEKEHWIFRIF